MSDPSAFLKALELFQSCVRYIHDLEHISLLSIDRLFIRPMARNSDDFASSVSPEKTLMEDFRIRRRAYEA
jgi:hypothetical protein